MINKATRFIEENEMALRQDMQAGVDLRGMIPIAIRNGVEAIALKEDRSRSSMAAKLIDEALKSREEGSAMFISLSGFAGTEKADLKTRISLEVRNAIAAIADSEGLSMSAAMTLLVLEALTARDVVLNLPTSQAVKALV